VHITHACIGVHVHVLPDSFICTVPHICTYPAWNVCVCVCACVISLMWIFEWLVNLSTCKKQTSCLSFEISDWASCINLILSVLLDLSRALICLSRNFLVSIALRLAFKARFLSSSWSFFSLASRAASSFALLSALFWRLYRFWCWTIRLSGHANCRNRI